MHVDLEPWKSGLCEGFYIDDEHERDETLIRAAKLQLAAAPTLAAWLQTRVSTDAGAAHPNCRRRMTTRISWKWEDCSHAMLLLRVPGRKDKVGWGGGVEDERLLCMLVVVYETLA
jgi:hypothetical protein